MNLPKLSFLLFGIAFVLTLAMFVFGWGLLGEYSLPLWVWWVWALLTLFVVVSMVALAVVAQDSTTRWLDLCLLAVVLLMASGLNILSFGVLIAPFGIALLAVSLFFLVKSRAERHTSV